MKERLVIYHNKRIYLLSADDICCIEADGSYCTIKLENGQNMRISKNLKQLFSEIPCSWIQMCRVQKSWLVNLNYVEYLYNTDKNVWSLHLFNGQEIPLSIRPDKILEMFNTKSSSIRKPQKTNSKTKSKVVEPPKSLVPETPNEVVKQMLLDNNEDYIIITP